MAPLPAKVFDGAGASQERLRRVLHPLSRRLWKMNIEGLENIPTDGPAIICPNHISFFDSVFVMTFVGRNISFVGKSEYMDSWKTRYLFPALGMIPIDRSGGEKSQEALQSAESVLRRGELFGIDRTDPARSAGDQSNSLGTIRHDNSPSALLDDGKCSDRDGAGHLYRRGATPYLGMIWPGRSGRKTCSGPWMSAVIAASACGSSWTMVTRCWRRSIGRRSPCRAGPWSFSFMALPAARTVTTC